jgi:hypothetical protein
MAGSRISRPMSGPTRYLVAVAGLLAVGLVGGVGVGFLSGQTGPGALAVTAGLITATMAVALGGGVWWWAKLDEAAREAHKWAWWWGGTAGIAVGSVLLLTVMIQGDATMITTLAGESPGQILVAGMMTILLFQLVGYTIAWAVWWLRCR